MSTDPLYGPALLIFSMAQLWVQKNLAWGLFVGSGPGYVTKLVWNEKAFAAWGLKKKKKEKKKQNTLTQPECYYAHQTLTNRTSYSGCFRLSST